MPRNASGTYTLPAGNPVSAGTLIEAAWANTTLNDLAAEMTDSLSRSGEGGMLASFKIADGTVALPGLAFTLEPGTGLSRLGTNEFDFSVGGSRVIQLNVNGMTVTAGLAVLVDTINESTADAGVTVEGVKLKDSKIEFTDVIIDSPATDTLAIKNTSTADDTPIKLTLQTGETEILFDDVLGEIGFQAPDHTGGGDATLVSAAIAAVSEGTFTTANNTTKLSFRTSVSETASEKASLSSAGNLTVSGTYNGGGTMTTGGNIVIPDGGYVGSASLTTAINILSDGNVSVGGTASDTIGLYVANDTTGDKVGQFYQANSGNTNVALQVSQAGTGTGMYSQVELGTNAAVFGFHNGDSSNIGIGTRGYSVPGYGGFFQTGSATYAGLISYSADSSEYAILGYQNAYGVYTTSLAATGTKSFQIPHGLRPGHVLQHSSIEGPLVDLIYRGSVDLVEGRAEISIDTKFQFTPGTFEWLTKNPQTFTSNETGWDAVRSSFSGDTITIECQNASSTDTISWMVVAERDDPNIRAASKTDSEGNLIVEYPSDSPPPPPPPPSEAAA